MDFPIKTATACLQKWSWSTIFINTATTASCHRVDHDELTLENFKEFHNVPRKLEDRELMLQGKWPGKGCEYCKKIEDAGGFSDRMLNQTPAYVSQNLTPVELKTNPLATKVTPTTLEVYFNNTCNFKCLYCGPWFSSKWQNELESFGPIFEKAELEIGPSVTDDPVMNAKNFNPHYEEMLKLFWEYLEENYSKLKRFHVLGGEPLIIDEFTDCLDFFENHPNPDMNFTIVTNLSIPDKKMDYYIARFAKLLGRKKIKSLQITASLDCWGPQQEYVRYGLDLKQWQKNFEKLLKLKWVELHINQAICGLTIKTLPELIDNISIWSQTRPIKHSYMSVTTSYMNPDIFDPGTFAKDFDIVEEKMSSIPSVYTEGDLKYMNGIRRQIEQSPAKPLQIKKLQKYLEQIDIRRKTDYRVLFPWLLEEFEKYSN